MMKKIVYIIATIILLSSNASAQNLVAKVNRTTIPQGETFILTLDYDGQISAANPNLNVLDKDFTIYSVSNSFQSRFLNGVTSQLRQWQIALMPKNAGKVIIPEIELNGIKSSPITLDVVTPDQLNSQQPDKQNDFRFALEGKADNLKPYVQQQINYTVTLYDTGGLQGSEPTFVDDGSNEWIIKSLKEPEISAKTINGKAAREIKFFYALFPQKSGNLTIPQFEFTGYYLTQNPRGRDPFEDIFRNGFFADNFGLSDMFATKNPVRLVTKTQKIDVLPIPPANKNNWWLPAKKVQLYSEWNPKPPVFRVGEAVNRTIYLKAIGVIENQLPEVILKNISNIRQYPEKPETQNTVVNNEIVAVKKIADVYIPSESGLATIPPVEINWFNVQTNQLEKAVLPSVNINVLPALNEAKTVVSIPSSNTKEGTDIMPEPQDNDKVVSPQPNKKQSNLYMWVIAAFIGGIFVSYFLFAPQKEHRKSLKDLKKEIIESANQNNYKALRDSLISWAHAFYKDEKITNLQDIAKLANNKDFDKEIDILSSELYGKSTENWNAHSFIKAYEKISKKSKQNKDFSPLPKLYK